MEVYVSGPKVTQGSRKPPFGSAWSDTWAQGSAACSGGGARRKDLGSSTLETEQSTLAGKKDKGAAQLQTSQGCRFLSRPAPGKGNGGGVWSQEPRRQVSEEPSQGTESDHRLETAAASVPSPRFLPSGVLGHLWTGEAACSPSSPSSDGNVCVCLPFLPPLHAERVGWGSTPRLLIPMCPDREELPRFNEAHARHGQADVVIG